MEPGRATSPLNISSSKIGLRIATASLALSGPINLVMVDSDAPPTDLLTFAKLGAGNPIWVRTRTKAR